MNQTTHEPNRELERLDAVIRILARDRERIEQNLAQATRRRAEMKLQMREKQNA